jgi:hypothetical protein
MENEYGKIKLISAWNDRKLEEKIKLQLILIGYKVDFSASFDKLGNIEVDYFTEVFGAGIGGGQTKLFKHPVLLQDVEPVIDEISNWLLDMEQEFGVMYE